MPIWNITVRHTAKKVLPKWRHIRPSFTNIIKENLEAVLLVYLHDSPVLLLAFEGQLSLYDWIEEMSDRRFKAEYYETLTQD